MRILAGVLTTLALTAGLATAAPAAATAERSAAYAVNDDGIIIGSVGDAAARWDTGGSLGKLETLPNSIVTHANGINGSGTIVGTDYVGDQQQVAVRWDADGAISELGGHDAVYSSARAVNDAGVTVGDIGGFTSGSAVRWDGEGRLARLDTPSGYVRATARAVNDSGAIAGYLSTGGSEPGTNRTRAVRWNSDGAATILPGLPDGGSSYALGIGRDGTVIGEAEDAAGNGHAVRWDGNGDLTRLATLPGDTVSSASAINDDGVIVGYTTTPDRARVHPVRWDGNGTVRELATRPGDTSGVAEGINGSGVIVGYTLDGDRTATAVRWNRDGTIGELGGNRGTP
ncbi:hypothetical protein [Amycolatopsis cihanbeyliensis]|uniref:Putative membrane protein n=1 Tax=Amycolatopsis cihanbeyliensis TaxID=1128664 RepID=A0A542DBH1_AMYCI|nr:hypothetical protein [Amycolatopsis cihanbeyliensis]TQJ00412.1 putative membrane protein [Amycolatopsis cihanbeyliensis]